MLDEVLDAAALKPGETVVDGTFGYGGYSEAFLARGARVVALDRDPGVKTRAAALSGPNLRFIETPFSRMDRLGLDPVDAVVLDIGVSSMQIDTPARGFSFQAAGPLDMRMGAEGVSAADAVNTLSRDELADLFRLYGEERYSRRAADAILRARAEDAIATTDGLAEIVERALGRRGRIHPATRVFQALRIFVNDELGELARALCAAETLLKPGGRLVVVTFHSLEDRIVKRFFRARAGEVEGGSRHAPEPVRTGPAPSFALPRRAALKARREEAAVNPRARSAKLRAGLRTSAPAHPCEDAHTPGAPRLADLAERLAA